MRKLYILYAIVLKHYLDANTWNKKDIHSDIKGICSVILICYMFDFINEKEYNKLLIHFESQRQPHHKCEFNSAYWFQQYKIKPRVELLKSLIEKCKPWYIKLFNKITKN